MRHKKHPNTLLQLRHRGNPEKIHWQIDSETKELVEEIEEIIQTLCGVAVSRAVIARRALLMLHEDLALLAMEGASPKFANRKNRESLLIRFMAKVEAVRDALFQAANRPQASNNPKFGRIPSAKALTGYELDTGAAAMKLARRLEGVLRNAR